MKRGFTMIELVFVIVVIGILAAIAVPKFALTRNDAVNTKGKATLASVRNAIAAERQQRVLRGDFTEITDLSAGGKVFDKFSADNQGNNKRVLEYPPKPCSGSETGCWTGSGSSYTFKLGGTGTCTFTLADNRLDGECTEFD